MLVVTVAGALTAEVVALHTASKTFTAADGGDIHALTSNKCVDGNFLADSKTINRIETKLDEATTCCNTCRSEVTGLRLGQLLWILLSVGDLQR